jgi:dimethylglycine dehydrogenase
VLRTPVRATNPRADGGWDVVTDQGTIICEHLVNAAGLWAREVGQMAGVTLPLHPMEHQYLVTGDIPEVYERGEELPHVMDPAGETYLRQEGKGLVIGIYEQDCVPWAVDGTSWDFGHELLNDDLDRIAEPLDAAYKRYPVLERAGIKSVINGPFTFAPDGNPLVGPVPGLRNYWSACAVMAGFSQGGGVGLTLAEWMIEGEPGRDVYAMDVARFGDYCTRPYTRMKVVENYQRRFSVSYPNEELPVGRPLDTTPAYGLWQARRAVFGSGYGLEHVNYFAPEGEPLYETPSFRRSNAFAAVGAECRAVRTAVGINEIHNFGKYLVEGPGAVDWLERIMANRVPPVGKIALSAMLSPKGKIIGDFTMARLADARIMLTASYSAQAFHMRWFLHHLPEDGSVKISNVSLDRIGFQIAGPNARDLLGRVTGADVTNAAMPFLSTTAVEIGPIPAQVNRVTYTGDLGYEIYVDSRHQAALFHALDAAGSDLGLTPFGMRAMMSLRLEKSFGSWMREFRPEFTPAETGLDRFCSLKKSGYIGYDTVAREKETPPDRRLATFLVDIPDTEDAADCHADEPISQNGEVIGYVTSGGYAHYSEKSVALGLIPRDRHDPTAAFEIEILGEMRKARLIEEVLFDPQAERMRG